MTEAKGTPSEELAYLRALRAANRLIKVAYPYAPKSRDWSCIPFIANLTAHMLRNEGIYQERLHSFTRFVPAFKSIALHEAKDKSGEPVWLNNWMPGFDAITLYGMLAERNPRWYVEVGSGNSTKFVRKAISTHGLRTKIISIDPQPRAEIDALCDEVIRKPCEDVDFSFFQTLTSEDILFVDNSHISFMNSDVTVFFCEILSVLPKGLVFGFHDIYLPFDYPDIWSDRWYNEQYLLLAYLIGGGQGDKIILPNYYLSHRGLPRQIFESFFSTQPFDQVQSAGGIFWMEKVGAVSPYAAP